MAGDEGLLKSKELTDSTEVFAQSEVEEEQILTEERPILEEESFQQESASSQIEATTAIQAGRLHVQDMLFGNEAELRTTENRALSEKLINAKKFSGDSKEMKKVKEKVKGIEEALTMTFTNEEVIKGSVPMIGNLYLEAIDACRNYLAVKTTRTRSDRNDLVRQKMMALVEEYNYLNLLEAKMREPQYDGWRSIMCGKDIITLGKIIELNAANDALMEEDREHEPVTRELDEEKTVNMAKMLDTTGKQVLSFLLLKAQPSSIAKKKGDPGATLAEFIYYMLKDFPEGEHLESFHTGLAGHKGNKLRSNKDKKGKDVAGSSLISIRQDKNGTLYFRSNGQEITLPYSRDSIISAMQLNMFENEKLYDDDFVQTEAEWIKTASLEDVNLRVMCLKIIEVKTGVPNTIFNNMDIASLRLIASNVLDGNIGKPQVIDLAKLNEEKYQSSLSGTATDHLINGDETRELLRNRLEHLTREQVEFRQQQRPAAQDQEEEQNEELSFTPEELEVKSFLADLVFSGDTWSSDENITKPGERVKKVIANNTHSIALIIKDEEVVFGMIDKLPIPGNKEKYKEKISAFRDRLINGFAPGDVFLSLAETEDIQKAIDTALPNVPQDEFKNIEKEIDGLVNMASTEIQKGIQGSVKALFASNNEEAPVQQERIGNPRERGLNPAQKKERVQKGIKRLNEMLKDSVSGNAGQGKFIKLVLQNYFSSVATIDQRAMIASVIRGAEASNMTFDALDAFLNRKDERAEQIDRDAKAAVESMDLATKDAHINEYRRLLNMDEIRAYAQSVREKESGDTVRSGLRRIGRLAEQALDLGEGTGDELIDDVLERPDRTQVEKRVADAVRDKMVYEIMKKLFEASRPAVDEPTEEERPAVEKDAMKVAGNYLGGLFKGAGPLLQKILQGLPIDAMPEELKPAFEDVKSKLAPIPKEIVEAQLLAMVERSKGEVTKIEVTRSLGAASVGQAFLCTMYGPGLGEEGKEVVIKLLRPDARNRMMREKEVMLRCAEQTDAGMKRTYEGQLERIEEELDLTIEAHNVELGQIYNKSRDKDKETDNVEAMKVSKIIAPTTTSMVCEKAPGTTVDRYMKDLKEEQLKVLEKFLSYRESNGTMRLNMNGAFPRINPSRPGVTVADRAEAKAKLMQMIAATKKRQKALVRLAEKWVTEGLFGEGFYHGDLHAGNIMVDDEKATVIDFGNATKLTEEQKDHVTRMMSAAALGEVGDFQEGFHALLNKASEERYQQKKGELKEMLKEVFALGDKTASGQRIAVALIRAQELGLELPAAIFNFSQSQLRLQNTIDSMNKEIDGMTTMMQHLNLKLEYYQNEFGTKVDFKKKAAFREGIFIGDATKDEILDDYASTIIDTINTNSFIYMLTTENESVRTLFDNEILQYLRDSKVEDEQELIGAIEEIRAVQAENGEVTGEMIDNVAALFEKRAKRRNAEFDDLLNRFQEKKPVFDSNMELTEKERTGRRVRYLHMETNYSSISHYQSEEQAMFIFFATQCDSPQKIMEYFTPYIEYFGPDLETEVNRFHESVSNMTKGQFDYSRHNIKFMSYVKLLALISIRERKEESTLEAPKIGGYNRDFMDVMGTVISENLSETLSRLGLFKSMSAKRRINEA